MAVIGCDFRRLPRGEISSVLRDMDVVIQGTECDCGKFPGENVLLLENVSMSEVFLH